MLIDSHIHLDAAAFDTDRQILLDDARVEGVRCFVVPAVSAGNFLPVSALAAQYAAIAPAYGIHPLYVMQAAQEDMTLLEQYLIREHTVAVGEIGLDAYVRNVDFAVQETFFAQQLKLARHYGLPVILHLRHAVDAVLKHLRRIEVCGGIAHAFAGSQQQAETLVAMGFKLGYGGAMTYGGSQRIRRLAALLPLEALVLETDAPDMAPNWLHGQRNVPASLGRYAQTLAGLRHIPVENVCRQTTENVLQVLPRLHSVMRRIDLTC